MQFMEKVYNQAKATPKKIVLPETKDIRIIQATARIISAGYAEVILVGKASEIQALASQANVDIQKATIIEPRSCADQDAYVEEYYQLRQRKGLASKEQAAQIVLDDYLFFGGMLVRKGDADGMVAGAERATADTLRTLFHCVGTAPGITTVSSFFAMVLPQKEYGNEGLLFFADCAVNPNPTAAQLADIAIATADNYALFTGSAPKVALLSFSTKGSAVHRDVDKVLKALEKIKQARPELEIDGELQFDAALIPKIGNKKAPGSTVAGQANVLIFPDLDAGNIGYKITQRLGGAEAIGPVIQGSAKPINDLSRGCSVEDIVNVTAITAVQACSH